MGGGEGRARSAMDMEEGGRRKGDQLGMAKDSVSGNGRRSSAVK